MDANGCCSFWFLLSLLPTASLQVVDSSPSPRGNEEGLCFSDGKRKVDYVLVFHQRRHSSIRCPASTSASHDRLSIVSNGNFPPSVGSDVDQGRGGIPGGDAPSVGEVFVELGGSEAVEPADHEIHLIRQEFEANLVEAGLEVERESEVSAHMLSVVSISSHDLHVKFFPWFSLGVQVHLWVFAKACKLVATFCNLAASLWLWPFKAKISGSTSWQP